MRREPVRHLGTWNVVIFIDRIRSNSILHTVNYLWNKTAAQMMPFQADTRFLHPKLLNLWIQDILIICCSWSACPGFYSRQTKETKHETDLLIRTGRQIETRGDIVQAVQLCHSQQKHNYCTHVVKNNNRIMTALGWPFLQYSWHNTCIITLWDTWVVFHYTWQSVQIRVRGNLFSRMELDPGFMVHFVLQIRWRVRIEDA